MSMKRGVSLFAAISVAGMIGVFFYSSEVTSLGELLDRIRWEWLFLCVFCAPLVDWCVAGFRMWLFAKVIAPTVSYAACVRNCAVGGFMGAATPSQTGGGVAQVYVLVKEGASPGQAVTVLFMTFMSTLIFYVLISVTLLVLSACGELPWLSTPVPFIIATIIFGTLLTLGLLTMARPARIQAWLERRSEWLERHEWLRRFVDRVQEGIREGGQGIERIARHEKRRFLASVPITVLVFGNKYFAGYLAARALGLHPPLLELMAMQVVLNVIIYFIPTPGGSGGAELSAAVLMSRFVPQPMLPPFTILWRTATMYLSVVVGGILLIRYLRREGAASPATMADADKEMQARSEV